MNGMPCMARFQVSVQPSLFGGLIVVRRRGRIGTSGIERQEFFESANGALAAQRALRPSPWQAEGQPI